MDCTEPLCDEATRKAWDAGMSPYLNPYERMLHHRTGLQQHWTLEAEISVAVFYVYLREQSQIFALV